MQQNFRGVLQRWHVNKIWFHWDLNSANPIKVYKFNDVMGVNSIKHRKLKVRSMFYSSFVVTYLSLLEIELGLL